MLCMAHKVFMIIIKHVVMMWDRLVLNSCDATYSAVAIICSLCCSNMKIAVKVYHGTVTFF